MDAFDADVLIYAASPDHELGGSVRELVFDDGGDLRVGSVLLVPELLSRPLRDGDDGEVAALLDVLDRLELIDIDLTTSQVAASLGATYGLGAADASHLAAAVVVGADRFVTNNRRDFKRTIAELEIVYPSDLASADG